MTRHKFPKGYTPWNKGLTKDTDKRLERTEEYKKSMTGSGNTFYKKKHTKESKIKIANRQYLTGKEHQFYGKHIWKNKKHPMTGTHPKGHWLGKHRSDKTKQKLRVGQLKLWQNEEYYKKMIELFQLKPNGSELYLDYILQNNFPDEWWFVGDGQMTLSGLCPDFVNVNGKKLIIELFGEHCHTDGGCFAGKRTSYRRTEKGRKEAFAKHGYSTLIIWYSELVNENKVIEKIRGWKT